MCHFIKNKELIVTMTICDCKIVVQMLIGGREIYFNNSDNQSIESAGVALVKGADVMNQ